MFFTGWSEGVPRGNFGVVNACINNEKRFQVDNPILYLTEQEMEQTKPKSRRRKQIIKIRAEAGKMESRKKQRISMKPSHLFWKDQQNWQTLS